MRVFPTFQRRGRQVSKGWGRQKRAWLSAGQHIELALFASRHDLAALSLGINYQ